MEEAITKTSKWHGTRWKLVKHLTVLYKKNRKISFALVLLRVWSFQLLHNFCERHHFVCGRVGNMRHSICHSGFNVWLELNHKSEGNFGSCCIFWYNLFVAFMGFFGWHHRKTSRHSTFIVNSCRYVCHQLIHSKLLYFHCTSVSQWIFVSFNFYQIYCGVSFLM